MTADSRAGQEAFARVAKKMAAEERAWKMDKVALLWARTDPTNRDLYASAALPNSEILFFRIKPESSAVYPFRLLCNGISLGGFGKIDDAKHDAVEYLEKMSDMAKHPVIANHQAFGPDEPITGPQIIRLLVMGFFVLSIFYAMFRGVFG